MSHKCHHNRSTIYLKCRTYHSYPLVSHTEYMSSCWFEVSYHQVMLSVCSQVHVYTSPLTHTLSHFAENLLTKTRSIIRTFAEPHCVVSTLSDQVLLPRITQSLRLPPRQSTLCNLGIDLADCHPEQSRNCPRIHSICTSHKPIHQAFLLVNWRV